MFSGEAGLKQRVLLLQIVLLCWGAGGLWANGVQENRLAHAKELIAQQNYNDAILILTQVVREEPDRQDEAQDLINQIRILRNQYNNDYEQLLKLLYQEKDENKALEVITKLETLDKNPNKQTQNQIKQAKRTARLIRNNRQFNDIMTRAAAFLAQKEYANAVKVYLEGYIVARDDFVDAEYGSVLTNSVERSWTDLKASSSLFVQNETSLQTLASTGAKLLASANGDLQAGSPAILTALKDWAGWRKRVWTSSQLFRTQNELIIRSGRQEDFYLSYSTLFVRGRPESKTPEGILAAMDLLWSQILDPWIAQIRQRVESQYNQAKTWLDQSQWNQASTAFADLKILADTGLKLTTLWNLQGYWLDDGTLEASYSARLSTLIPVGLWFQSRYELALQGGSAAQHLDQDTQLMAAPVEERVALVRARQILFEQRADFSQFSQTTDALNRRTEALSRAGWKPTETTLFWADWQKRWLAYRQRVSGWEASFVDRLGKWDFDVLDGRNRDLQQALDSAQTLAEGRPRYSLQATQQLDKLRPLQISLQTDVSAFISLYTQEATDLPTPEVQAWPPRGRDLAARLAQAQTRQNQLALLAKANYDQSLVLKKQGQDSVPQVVAAIAGENFKRARDLLNQEIAAKYSQSLSLQEDPAFRTDSDRQVKDLFDRILKGENELVVRDVRQFVTQGSQAYLSGQYNQADQILQRAKVRWATTNTDPNSEVEYWLRLANFALSVTTGRELTPVDPLYNEIQQLLNYARRNYELAQTLLQNGSKAEALVLLDQGRTLLGKILVPFPLNQEARLLNLQILKSRDPEAFPALFRDTFNAAVTKIGVNPQEAYSDLQDLEKIQADFEGLGSAIKRVRLVLGIDRAPPDPKLLAEARSLITLARRIYDSGATAQFTTALAQIKRALALDPNNAEAQDLFDKISLRTVSTVQTMTPSQLQEFNDIGKLFIEGRTLEAKARLNDFKARFPALRGDARVKELEKRIQAVS